MSSTAKFQFGLIGYPLSHSFSARYFNEKFERKGWKDHHYELFPLESIEEFPGLLSQVPHLKGLNVTIPYKQSVIPYLDKLSEAAAAIGAVNTIKLIDGRTTGYNTDVYGFQQSLEKCLAGHGRSMPEQALILGTGGAAKAVSWVLEQLGISFRYVSRRPAPGQLEYEQLDRKMIAQVQLIVNTTPLGMSPNTDTFPMIPYRLLNPQHLMFDLIYNPQKTVFLTRAENQGCGTINGLEMLHLQAEKAWEIWTRSNELI